MLPYSEYVFSIESFCRVNELLVSTKNIPPFSAVILKIDNEMQMI